MELHLQAYDGLTDHVNCCWLSQQVQHSEVSGGVLEENHTGRQKLLVHGEFMCEVLGVDSEVVYIEVGHLVFRSSRLDDQGSLLNE